MHQTRSQTNKKIPLERKGTKYVARPLSDLQNSVPVVIAVRDMLKLAKTAREVRKMVQDKLLKINGKEAKDYRSSIRLFNLFEADKNYILTLTEHGKFALEETSAKERMGKVIGKKILAGKKVQVNLHDGTNLLITSPVKTQTTVYLDNSNKIKKNVDFEKGKECIVIEGKYLGRKGKITSLSEDKVTLQFSDDKEASLAKKGVVVL